MQNLSKPGVMVAAGSMGQSPLTVRLLGTEKVSSKPGARAQWMSHGTHSTRPRSTEGRASPRDREVARLVKCLLCKRKDLSLGPSAEEGATLG